MMKKILLALGLTSALLFGGTTIPIKTYDLQCPVSILEDVYDTPSGKLTEGYYDPTFMRGVKDATATSAAQALIPVYPLRKQARAICYEADGRKYKIDISDEEYGRHSVKGSPALKLKRTTTLFDSQL